MKVKDVYRNMLLRYPTLYKCPLDVSCHLFTSIGGGFEWVNGELEEVCCGFKTEFKGFKNYSKYNNDEYYKVLNNGYQLEYEANNLMYDFIKNNIDKVLECKVTTSFFQPYIRHGYYEINPCTNYSKCVIFPDNITPEWASAVQHFLSWWILNLRHHYHVGLGSVKTEREHWPKDINEAYDKLIDAKNRIDEKLGLTKKIKQEQNKLANEIIEEILKGERS